MAVETTKSISCALPAEWLGVREIHEPVVKARSWIRIGLSHFVLRVTPAYLLTGIHYGDDVKANTYPRQEDEYRCCECPAIGLDHHPQDSPYHIHSQERCPPGDGQFLYCVIYQSREEEDGQLDGSEFPGSQGTAEPETGGHRQCEQGGEAR